MTPAWLSPANWFRRQAIPTPEIEDEDEYEPQLDELTEAHVDVDDTQPFTASLSANEEDNAIPENYGEEFAPGLEEEDITERLIARRNSMELYTTKELDERFENQYATVLRKLKERDFDAATAWRLIVGFDAECKRDRNQQFHDLIEPVLLGTATIAAIIDDMWRYVVPSKYRNHGRYNELRGTAMDLFEGGWPQDFLHAFIKEIQSDLIPVEEWSDELENSTQNKDAEEVLFRWAPKLWEIWREGPTKMDDSSIRRKTDEFKDEMGNHSIRKKMAYYANVTGGRAASSPDIFTLTKERGLTPLQAWRLYDAVASDNSNRNIEAAVDNDDDDDERKRGGAFLEEIYEGIDKVTKSKTLYEDYIQDQYKKVFAQYHPSLRSVLKKLWWHGFTESYLRNYMHEVCRIDWSRRTRPPPGFDPRHPIATLRQDDQMDIANRLDAELGCLDPLEWLLEYAPRLTDIWPELGNEDVVMSGIGTPKPRTFSNSPRTPKYSGQTSSGRGSQTPTFYTANETIPESDSGSDAETTVDEIIDGICLEHRPDLEFTDGDLDQMEELRSSDLGPVDVWRIFAVLLEEVGSAEAVLADSRLCDITSGGRKSRKWLDWYDDQYKIIFCDCGPELRRTAKYLWARGFDEHFVKGYMDFLRDRYPILDEEDTALAVQLEDHFEEVDVLDWLSRWAPELNTIWSRQLPEDAPQSDLNHSSFSSDEGNGGDDGKDKAAGLGNRYPLRTPPLPDDGSALPDYEQSPPGVGPDSALSKVPELQKLMYGNCRFDLPRGGRKSKKQESSDSGHRPGVDIPHSPPLEPGRGTAGPRPKPYQPSTTNFTPGVDTPHSPPPPNRRSPTPKSVSTAKARRQSVLPSREEINARVIEKTKSLVKGDTMVVQLRALKDRGYSVRDALHLWVETREVTEGPREQVKKLQELRNHPMDAQDFLQKTYREAFSVVKDPHLRQTLKSLWWKGFDSRYIWNYIVELEMADPSLKTDDSRKADVLEIDLAPWDISEWLFQFRPRFREVWDESEVKADLVTPLSSPKPSGRSLLDENFLDLTDRPFIWNYLHGQGQDPHWVQDFPDWDKRDSLTLVRSGLDQFLAWRLVDGLRHRRIEDPERIAAVDLLASDKNLALRVLAAYKEQMFKRLGLVGEEFEGVRKAMTEMLDSKENEPFLEYAVRQDCEQRTPEKLHDFMTELVEERRKLEKENSGKLVRRCILGDYFYDKRISRNGTEMADGDRKLYEGYDAPTDNFDKLNDRYFRDFVLQAVDPSIWQECACRGWSPAQAWATLTAIFYPRFRNDTAGYDLAEGEEYDLAVEDQEYRKQLTLDWCSTFLKDLKNREDPEMVELVECYMNRHLDGFLIEKLKHDLLTTGNYATRKKLHGALSGKLSEKDIDEWTFEWVPSLKDAWLHPRDPSPGSSDDGGDDSGDDNDGESGKDDCPPPKRSRESDMDLSDGDGDSDDDSPPPPKRPRSGTPFPYDEYGAPYIVSDPSSSSDSDSDSDPDEFLGSVARRLSYNSPTPPRPATPLGPNVSFEDMFIGNRPTPKSTFKDFKPKKVDNLRYTNRLWTPRRLPNTPTKSHLPPSPRRKGTKPRVCEACGRPFGVTKKKKPAEPRRSPRKTLKPGTYKT